MNSNVKRLTFIHYGWHRHRMMSKTGGLWDRLTHCKRSNRKQRSASRRKKRISLLPDGATLKYSSVHGMVCKAFRCWLPDPQDVGKHRHACHGNQTASLPYTQSTANFSWHTFAQLVRIELENGYLCCRCVWECVCVCAWVNREGTNLCNTPTVNRFY